MDETTELFPWVVGTALSILTLAFGYVNNRISRTEDRIAKEQERQDDVALASRQSMRDDLRSVWAALEITRAATSDLMKEVVTKDDLRELRAEMNARLVEIRSMLRGATP